jgi:hypothetical protein
MTMTQSPNIPDRGQTAYLEPGPSSSTPSTTDVAKEQVVDVRDSAAQAGQHVADVAKAQAADVTKEAGRQAKDLLQQSRHELQEQVSSQQQRVAVGLHSLGEELQHMAQGSEQQGLASDLAREAAERTSAVATWLDDREPGALLDEVRSFARQRPGAFLALAAGAGVLAGRLGRGLQAGTPDTADTPGATGAAGATESAGAVHPAAMDVAPTADYPDAEPFGSRYATASAVERPWDVTP